MDGRLPCIPPLCPCIFSSSRRAIAAPCLTSQAGLKRSTSNSLTTPSQIHEPDDTSNALDCGADLADTAPPFDGSTTTLSEEGPLAVVGLSSRDLGASRSSVATRRALDM